MTSAEVQNHPAGVATPARSGARIHGWIAALGFVVAGLGPWPQVFAVGGIGTFGLLWSTVAALNIAALVVYIGVPLSARIPIALLSVPAAIAGIHLVRNTNGASIGIALLILPLAFVVAMTAAVRRPEQMKKLLLAGGRWMALLLCLGIVVKLALFGADGRELSSRPFGHGGAVALLLLAAGARTPLAVFRTLPGIAASVTIILSLSRTSWLMAALGMGVLIHVSYGRDIERALRIIWISIFAFTGAWLLYDRVPLIRTRFVGTGGGGGISLSTREDVWPLVAGGVGERPLLGHGPGASARLVALLTQGESANPHNDFLRLSYDVGVLSVLALLFGIVLVARRLRRFGLGHALGRAGFAVAAVVPVFLLFTNGITYLGVSVPIFAILGAAHGTSAGAAPPSVRR